MVKPFVLAIGAIPVIFALLIVIPMLTSTDIPTQQLILVIRYKSSLPNTI